MAEFAEVMRQAHRMCDVCKCDDCPMADHVDMCGLIHSKYRKEGILLEFERIVMQWAKEHPEPQYPTWEEWQRDNFPGTLRFLCQCHFVAKDALENAIGEKCEHIKCSECRARPIPADIAKKLGIRPKEVQM